MNGSPENIALIKVNSIVQINPKAELSNGNGRLAVVVSKLSWGCNLRVDGIEGTIPVSWAHFEPTGGMLVMAPDGSIVTAPAIPQRHHP